MHWLKTNIHKAVAYYRHSAEDKQENSIEIQKKYAHKFAEKHSLQIIHEETDEGKTGLNADRPGFSRLFDNWVLNPDAPQFTYILVYDVTRWGRFQDNDESAFYEFQCKQRGKKVIYVARGFPQKENQLIEHLITSIERFMAAEYSRQLSEKVFHGCVKVTEQGYSAGGPPCYGMSRLLLDVNKKPVRILKKGEHKSIANERVTFVPLNNETTENIKHIFHLFVNKGMSLEEIVEELNLRNIPSPAGSIWSNYKVNHILTNEIYIGHRVYNKTSSRLKRGRKKNPKDQWIICKNAFPAIIERELFFQAKEKLCRLEALRSKKMNYVFKKVQRDFIQELRNYLIDQRILKDGNLIKIKDFPLIFSVKLLSHENIPSWCFAINEVMRRYKYILAIGTVLEGVKYIDRFFLIPTKNFGLGGVIFFSEKDTEYSNYYLKEEKINETVTSLVQYRVI